MDETKLKETPLASGQSIAPTGRREAAVVAAAAPLLVARGLKKHYVHGGGFLSKEKTVVRAVDGVDLEIHAGENLALVGESGSGKTTTGKLLIRLIEPTEGSVEFRGVKIHELSKKGLRAIRKQMQIIHQDALSALNPHRTIRQILRQPFVINGERAERRSIDAKVVRLLEDVGLTPPEAFLDRYPHELSGGQRQRIVTARAIALRPILVVADEPVSALDVSIRAQLLNLMVKLQKETGLTYLFITHDMAVVRSISQRVAVMYLGQIIELGAVDDIFENTGHPYTKSLLSATPVPDPKRARTRKKIILKGDVPSPANPPSGCRFRTRCPLAVPRCAEPVDMVDLGGGHQARCIFATDLASKKIDV